MALICNHTTFQMVKEQVGMAALAPIRRKDEHVEVAKG